MQRFGYSCFVSLMVALALPITVSAQGVNFPLPTWPIANIGPEIEPASIEQWRALGAMCPANLPMHSAFPSKAKFTLDDVGAHPSNDEPGAFCDDNDMTLFNALLCVADVEEGCRAVIEAQGTSDRWYRSPSRRWWYQNMCFNNPKMDPIIFCARCADGFSPDMSLGVLLYVIKTKDSARLRRWLSFVQEQVGTTVLCSKDGDQYVRCSKFPWPRVCTDDMVCTNPNAKPNPLEQTTGKFGGHCMLRPWDAFDFAPASRAAAVPLPAGVAQFDVTSRVMWTGVLAAIPAIGPLATPIPPLIAFAQTEAPHYPLHLDAARVLLRMLIYNPELEMKALPTVPDLTSLPTQIGPGDLDAMNPLTISAAAQIIASRAPWNPYYQLLANGPTPAVRDKIFERCPANGETVSGKQWLWEQDEELNPQGVPKNHRSQSMGWDCVFVAKLYNKMRVKENIVKAILDEALRQADGTGRLLAASAAVLNALNVALENAQLAVNQAEANLANAITFVGTSHKQLRDAALASMNQQAAVALSAKQQLDQLAIDIAKKSQEWMDTVDQIEEAFEEKFCPEALVFNDCPVTEQVRRATRLVGNPAKAVAAAAVDALKAKQDAENKVLAAAQSAVSSAEQLIKQLDDQLVAQQTMLASKVLETAVAVTKADLAVKQKTVVDAQGEVSKAQAANKQVNDYLAIWRKS